MLNISFFSYKGGAGRTSLLFNTLPFLAEELGANENEPIVVLDLDLDSQGLTYLTESQSKINTIQVIRGDNSLGFRQIGTMREHPFFRQAVPIGQRVGLPESQDRAILFVSAQPLLGAESLSEEGNYDSNNVSLSNISRLCSRFNCKAIVMDTPSGNQLSGKKALSISNKIVTVMRITKQFRKGTAEFLRDRTELSNKEFIIVPNAVPTSLGTNYNLHTIMENISGLLKLSINNPSDLNLKFLENGNTGINEVNLFKFTEENLKLEQSYRELKPDEKNAIEMYKLLAKEIANES